MPWKAQPLRWPVRLPASCEDTNPLIESQDHEDVTGGGIVDDDYKINASSVEVSRSPVATAWPSIAQLALRTSPAMRIHSRACRPGLTAAWTDEFSGVTAGFLSGDRIGVITGGHLLVKEGGLTAAWVDEFSPVTDAALSGNRIGVLSGGHFLVKEGGLTTTWTDEFTGVTAGVLPSH